MSTLKTIFLCGFMGCGKSTFGKKLALSSGLPHYDLDVYIERNEARSISSIFELEGEQNFRLKERSYLHHLIHLEGEKIISLGGGTVCYFDNLSVIKSAGVLLYLELSVKTLTQRLKLSAGERPLLKNLKDDELFEYVEKKLSERLAFYQAADLTLNGLHLNASTVIQQLETTSN